MNKLTTALAAALVMVSTVTIALAQKTPADRQRTETGNKAQDTQRQAGKDALRPHPGGLVEAKWLIGSRVHDGEGRDIGRIEELWLDPKSGEAKEVIVSVGSVLGIGGKDRVVAFKDVQIGWKDQKFYVSIDPNALRDAVEVEKDRHERGPASASPKTGRSR